jgi:hypothetical protein
MYKNAMLTFTNLTPNELSIQISSDWSSNSSSIPPYESFQVLLSIPRADYNVSIQDLNTRGNSLATQFTVNVDNPFWEGCQPSITSQSTTGGYKPTYQIIQNGSYHYGYAAGVQIGLTQTYSGPPSE